MNGFLRLLWSWRHIGAAVAVWIAILGFLYGSKEPEVVVAPPVPVKQILDRPAVAILPKGYAPGAVSGNPFAIPKEYAPLPQKTAIALSPPLSPATKAANESAPPNRILPVLTGTVGSGERWIAIIQYGGTSQYYEAGDVIGPYKLVGVTATEASIIGPGGSYSLPISRAFLSGGTGSLQKTGR